MGKHTREYRVWDANEEAALKLGVKKHGLGAWEIIRNDPEFEVLLNRTGVQLKDKWRNLIKFRHVSLDDKELFQNKGPQAAKLDKQPSCRSSARSACLQAGTPQESGRGFEGRSESPTESGPNCDRASQKSLFRSSSRRRKSALAADFVLDVDVEEDDTEDMQINLPSRGMKRPLGPNEDRRYGIYDKRRYKPGSAQQGSASDVSDSGFLDEKGGDSYAVKCLCGATNDDGEEMIECEICKTWAHTSCLEHHQRQHPSEFKLDTSCYTCPCCQQGALQPCSKRRAVSPPYSMVSQSSEQDSRGSVSVYSMDCKSGISDVHRKGLHTQHKIKSESEEPDGNAPAVNLPQAPQRQRSKRNRNKRIGKDWYTWLLPERLMQPRFTTPGAAPTHFSSVSQQMPPPHSKQPLERMQQLLKTTGSAAVAPMDQARGMPRLKHRTMASLAVPCSPRPKHSLKECQASPASMKTCHTAEPKLPVTVLCGGEVGMHPKDLVLLEEEGDEDDHSVVSSSAGRSSVVGMASAGVGASGATAGSRGCSEQLPVSALMAVSQADAELLAGADLDLAADRFPDFPPPPRRVENQLPPQPTLPPQQQQPQQQQPQQQQQQQQQQPPFILDMSSLSMLAGCNPAAFNLLASHHHAQHQHHLSAPLHTHPPLFNLGGPNLSALGATLGATLGAPPLGPLPLDKLETDPAMLLHRPSPLVQALLAQQAAWSHLPAAAAAAVAAAAPPIAGPTAHSLYKHSLGLPHSLPGLSMPLPGLSMPLPGLSMPLPGLSMPPPPTLKLEPLPLHPALGNAAATKPPADHPAMDVNAGITSGLNVVAGAGLLNAASANRSVIDQAVTDAALLPLLEHLRSQTPDPTNFLNAPTPIPEMSLPLPFSGPLFDFPTNIPLSKTPPLPDGLLSALNMAPPIMFEPSKSRPDDAVNPGCDFLHDYPDT